ncbi:MAG: TonB-dependent receptor [Ferruginibacter sp.]
MRKWMMMLMLALGCSFNLAAQNGSLEGNISTADGQPADGVSVAIPALSRYAVTNAKGFYSIKNIKPGTWDLVINLVGNKKETKQVTITSGQKTDADVTLSIDAKELESVVVVSDGRSSLKVNRTSTSLRLQTPLLELPQNIQVVTSKALTDQQVISMSDGLIRNVSGAVRMEHWGDLYTNISMRGSQVQAFRNGFNVVASYWGPLTEDMSFVERIEFVKGPAGFMLSSGDPSGLYNVVTKKPTGQTKGEASLTVGSFGLYRGTLDLDGKLSKDGKLLYRLNLAAQNKASFRPYEENDRYSIAPVISYQVDDKTKLTAEYTYQFAKMSDVGSYYVFSPDGYATLPRDFTLMAPGLDPTKINDQTFLVNLEHQFNSDWKLTAQATYLKYNQVGSSLWPNSVNADGTMIRSVGIWDAQSDMTLAQAFINGKVKTGTIQHKLLGGLDMGNKNYMADWAQSHALDTANGGEFNPAAPNYGVPANGFPSFDRTTSLRARAQKAGGLMDQQYTAIYVQDELAFFNDKLRVTVAGRYTDLSQSAWGGSPDKAKHFTPRAGLSYSINKTLSAYALYDQSFTPQSGRLSNGDKVKPITGNNQELGVKKDWGNGTWNTTLAAYRILKENELTADPAAPVNSGLSVVMGQKVAHGIEFDLRGKLAQGLTLTANYAYTEAKITKVADGVTVYKVGDIVPGYSTHTANAWLSYTLQDGPLKNVGFSGGFSFLGNRKTEWELSSKKMPDYFKLDGGISWDNNKIRLSANVFNILDRYLYSGSLYSYLNAYYWQAEAPRNVRFQIAYKF